jgi:hypothetical protein
VDEILEPVERAQARLQECQGELVSQGVAQTVTNSDSILKVVSRQSSEFTELKNDINEELLPRVQQLVNMFQTIARDMRHVTQQDSKNSLFVCVQEDLRTQSLRNCELVPAALLQSSVN